MRPDIDEWIERELERVGPLPDWALEDAARVIEQDRRERRERQKRQERQEVTTA